MHDLIRGEVRVNTATLDDKVLFKSDGMPTYHLANVVDDHLMKISHVIRGEEWLPSMPLHVMLYKAFEWTETQPEFAHLRHEYQYFWPFQLAFLVVCQLRKYRVRL